MKQAKFSARQVYYIMLISIGLAVVVSLGSAYGANTVLVGQSKQVTAAHLSAAVAEEKQHQLSKAKADITKYAELGKIAKNIVPQDKDQAQTVREIVGIAEDNGIQLGTITFPTSSLGGNGKAGASSKPELSQLIPNAGVPGVYSLDINIESDAAKPAPFNKFMDFLDDLEHNRRTAMVKSVSIQPDSANPKNISFTLTVSESIKP